MKTRDVHAQLHVEAVRRAVHERDGGRCTYRDSRGRRCSKRHDLEFHHEGKPFGKEGDHSPENITLVCRAHNLLRAEEEYGEGMMAGFLGSTTRVSEPVAVYGSRRPPGLPGSPPG